MVEVLQPQFKHLIVFESNPEYLVERITDILENEYKDIKGELTVCFDWIDDTQVKTKDHKG